MHTNKLKILIIHSYYLIRGGEDVIFEQEAKLLDQVYTVEKMVFIKEIPKTSVGKFNKKELRRLYAEGKL